MPVICHKIISMPCLSKQDLEFGTVSGSNKWASDVL